MSIARSIFTREAQASIDIDKPEPGNDGITQYCVPDTSGPQRFYLIVGTCMDHKTKPDSYRLFRSLPEAEKKCEEIQSFTDRWMYEVFPVILG